MGCLKVDVVNVRACGVLFMCLNVHVCVFTHSVICADGMKLSPL